MKNSKFLQKTFFLLVAGISLSALQACEEKDEPVLAPSIDREDMIESVDLGLPSGTRWASCNIGASSPEEYGDYFAWGETTVKGDYSWQTYQWCNGTYESMSTDCVDSIELNQQYDAALAKWGEQWRMPTMVDFKELTTECTWTWTTQNGVKGYEVKGTNGNSIFLPAAGCRRDGTVLHSGYTGCYWSTTLYGDDAQHAHLLYFDDNTYSYNFRNFRVDGRSVRAVTNEDIVNDKPSEDNPNDAEMSVKGTTWTIYHTEYYETNGNIEFESDAQWKVYFHDDGSYSDSESGRGSWTQNGNEITVHVTYQNDNSDMTIKMTIIEVFDNGTSAIIEMPCLCSDFDDEGNGRYGWHSHHRTWATTKNLDDNKNESGISMVNGHEAVDLGLSVKWATCNVGANSPEESGGYYAWGETVEKNNYDSDTYEYKNMNIGDNISGTQYDVARVKWGESWRMPTVDEFVELINNCTYESGATLNGITGARVIGPNGNSIFIPNTGVYADTEITVTWGAFLRSGTLDEDESHRAYYLVGGGVPYLSAGYEGYRGLAVRPVCD